MADVKRRAVAAGIDPAGPDFSTWVGDLLVSAIPGAVADILSLEAELPPTGGGSSDILTGATVVGIIPPCGLPEGSQGNGVD